jgi:hypothetical protein
MNTLIDKVISQIESDMLAGDTTAIYELLAQVPEESLKAFLPEEQESAEAARWAALAKVMAEHDVPF